jgi:ATP-dependent DNA helicase RecG
MVTPYESEFIEFKRGMPSAGALAKEIVAFANGAGGEIYLGVEKDGTVVGITVTPELLDRIQSICNTIEPPITPRLETRTMKGQEVLVIAVAEGDRKPYLVDGRCYVRAGSTTRPATRDEIFRLGYQYRLLRYDEQPAPGATYDDIDPTQVDRYLQRRVEVRGMAGPVPSDRRQLLRNLDALTKVGEELIPTRGGLLVFGREPQKFLPHSEIRLARFKGVEMGNFVDRADLRGTLPEMIDEAEKFVRRNIRLIGVREGFQRVDRLEYPLVAVREAITNAVAHRDYAIEDSTIRVAIFDDRIEVYSPGGLPPGVTVDNIEGNHVLRNRVIANLLYDMGYIEKWGSGVIAMKRAMRAWGLPDPKFEDFGTVRVTLYGPGKEAVEELVRLDARKLKEAGFPRW